jgi:hypothetical protein
MFILSVNDRSYLWPLEEKLIESETQRGYEHLPIKPPWVCGSVNGLKLLQTCADDHFHLDDDF